MPIIKISTTSLEPSLVSTNESLLRSLEHYLKKHQLAYECADADKEFFVQVTNELDAFRLGKLLKLREVVFISDLGVSKRLSLTAVKRVGRAKNMVYDQKIGKGLTLNQYTKRARLESMSKSEILKRGILTKTQLEAGIVSGKLTAIGTSTSTRITKESLLKFVS